MRANTFAAVLFLTSALPTMQADPAMAVVASGVTYERGLPAQGGIATLYVAGLDVAGIIAAQGAPLPSSLAGITVDVCGAPAPIFAVAALDGYQQVNFQVPGGAQTRFDGTYYHCVVTVRQGSFEAADDAYVRTWTAGDLFFTPDWVGIFQHGADYSRVTRADPARPGEAVVLYAAALPATVPAVDPGQAAPFDPLAVVPESHTIVSWREITLYVDSTPVHPLFVGLSPGQVGLYQINFLVPDGTATGDHAVKLEIGSCGAFHGGGCLGPTGHTTSNPVALPVGPSSGTANLAAAYAACGGPGTAWFPDLRRGQAAIGAEVMVKF